MDGSGERCWVGRVCALMGVVVAAQAPACAALPHPTPSLVPGVATPCPPPSHPAVIRVLRDIAPGEEITMSYIGEGMRARESAGTLTLHAACLPYCLPP